MRVVHHVARLVDLGAVVLGFGIFLANTAFEFQQTSSGGMTGWGYDHRGALGQVEVAYALAIVATAMITAPLGVAAAHRLSPRLLRRVFGVYLVVTGITMIAKA